MLESIEAIVVCNIRPRAIRQQKKKPKKTRCQIPVKLTRVATSEYGGCWAA